MHYYNTHRYIAFIVVLGLAFAYLSCQTNNLPENRPASAPGTSLNTNTTTTNSAALAEADSNAFPVTMPLLDAMFSDDAFANEAKQKLQLTDEQLQKISDAAKNAVLKLGTEPPEDNSRSTQASVKSTRTKLDNILGPEKAAEFLSFVRD